MNGGQAGGGLVPIFQIVLPAYPPYKANEGKRYFDDGIPNSLQIFLTKVSVISECLGTAVLLLSLGLCHHECFLPSLKREQP